MSINSKKKQQLLIDFLISSPDTYALCKSIVKSKYFDPEFRQAVSFLNDYYDKYNSLPSPYQIEAETDVVVTLQQVTRDQIKYCSEEVEAFCKVEAMKHAIWDSPELIKQGNLAKVEELIREAVTVSLNRDMGLSYYVDPQKRLEERAKQPLRTPTGISVIDDALNGGLARTEILLFSANSGGGKSITLANVALNMLEQGLNVLYLSLELSEAMIAERYDIMHTGIPLALAQSQQREIANALKIAGKTNGNLVIKKMPSGATANDIRAYLKEFELLYGYIPDLLALDYLDIMGSNEHVSADNISEKDKRAAEQLRDIGFDYNMFIVTASQQNRDALKAPELHQGHIAGGITKVNTVDVYISILLNPTMKAQGIIGFNFLKSRSSDATGKLVYTGWDNKSLRIINKMVDNQDRIIVDSINALKQQSTPEKKPSLMNLMNRK